MQSVSSRIWTRVALSISCDDNHYTTGTSGLFHIGFQTFVVLCQAYQRFLNDLDNVIATGVDTYILPSIAGLF